MSASAGVLAESTPERHGTCRDPRLRLLGNCIQSHSSADIESGSLKDKKMNGNDEYVGILLVRVMWVRCYADTGRNSSERS